MSNQSYQTIKSMNKSVITNNYITELHRIVQIAVIPGGIVTFVMHAII